MLSQRPVPRPRGDTATGPGTFADVQAFIARLETSIHVVFTPLSDVVARLDTTGDTKVLYLDSGSPPEDHFWVLWEVLPLLALGPDGAGAAVSASRMRWLRA